MIKQYTYGDIAWFDLESPTLEEIKKISLVYGLNPTIEEELLTPTLKPKVDRYENHLYVILHFPALKQKAESSNREIDFVVGKKFIITTHYDSFDPLHTFADTFDSKGSKNAFNKGRSDIHGGHVFIEMMQNLYHSLLSELEILSTVLLKAEKKLFAGNEKGMLITLSKINRDLLDFKASTNLHRSVLESFDTESRNFFGETYAKYTKDIMNEYYKIYSSIQESKDFLEELRRTNDSLLSNKQNEIMKTVTVLAFIFLPLSLLASIFGMNIDNMPLVNLPHSFAFITSGMALVAIIILFLARYNEWL